MKKVVLILTLALLGSPVLISAQTKWQQTAATVSFGVKNRGSNVPGTFSGISTTLVFSPDKLASSSLKGALNINTINTGNTKRDKDLKDETYFDAAKHPTIQVSSTSLSKKGAQYVGNFNVTIKGVTKQVQIPFSFAQQGKNATFRGSFTINRRDFGVGNKKGLALFMSDDVNVTITVQAKS